MQRSPPAIASVVLALALAAPGSAFAQDPSVTFDNGPSSKEYAIPLDAARGQTKTKAPTARVRTTPAPAATAAATPPPTATATTATTPGKPESKSTTKQAVAPVATTPEPPASDAVRVTTPASSSSDGTGAGLVIGGLAFAAVMLGGLAGLVLRRRRQPIDEH